MSLALPGPAILFCPGNRPERFDKAIDAADVVILDLEDAVPALDKEAARTDVVAACERLGDQPLIVRVNAVGTRWHDGDVAALRALAESTGSTVPIMLPKSESADQLRALADFGVVALCESARGVLNAAALAEAPNCEALMWGAEDLIADLGGRSSRSPAGAYYRVIEQARANILFAAAAAAKAAFDAVYLDIDDLDGLALECAEAVDLGFRAKVCIHPRQAAVVRAAYAPSPERLAWAAGVLAEAARSGDAVFSYEGKMIDAPLFAQAKAILAHAEP